MTLLDLLTSPWAIEPAKYEQLWRIWEAHARGEKIDIAAVEAQLGRPLAREQQGYAVQDEVAIVPVDGVIAQRANLFSRVSGGASSQLIERDIRGALADSRVRAIVLEINSPGGTVHGTQELAEFVDRARAEKPIAAYATGQMASAAYWIGAAADRVYISGDNVFAGSIGIVATHVDRSQQEKQAGIKTTEVVAGRYKRMASEYAPLDKEGRAHMQQFVDYLYSVFVGDVAAYRGVSVERVLSDMADGRVFIGRQAIDAGLVDGVSTLDDLVAMLRQGQMPRRGPTRRQAAVARVPSGGAPAGEADPQAASASHDASAGGAPEAAVPAVEAGGDPVAQGTQETQPSNSTGATMNREQLQAAHPELLEAILAEGRTDGARAERERIQGVEAQAMPGHADLIARLKYDGKTTGPEAAAQILAAERQKLGKRAQDILADAAAVATAAPSPTAAGPAPASGDDEPQPVSGGVITEDQAKAEWEKDARVRAEFGGRFADYFAVRKAEVAGRDKVLGKKAA